MPEQPRPNSPEVQKLLRKVGEFMAKYQVPDLSRRLNGAYADRGAVLVELGELVGFLTGSGVGLRRDEAWTVAACFEYEQGRAGGHRARCVDLGKLHKALLEQEHADIRGWDAKDWRQQQSVAQRGYEVIETVRKHVEEHILRSGGSVFKAFQEFDREGTNYLSLDDLLRGLQALGARDLRRGDVQQVYDLMDENRDGRVSYAEFAGVLASCSATARLDDPSHWAFHIFEDLRRRLRRDEEGLARIFRVSPPPPGQGGRTLVQWREFLDRLRGFGVMLRPGQERELQELLDTASTGGQVDLAVFQSLVGIGEDACRAHGEALDWWRRRPPDGRW